MFKIGEFSKLAQVSVRMLRYYDEVGLLKPAEVDPWTGHRLYSPDQIPRLNKILYLRDSGFHVSEIAMALEMDDALLYECLLNKQKEVEKNIQAEQEKLRKLETAKDAILGKKAETHYNISMKSVPACLVLSLRKVVPTYYSEGDMWNELCAFAKEQKIEISSNTFSIYHDSSYREQDVDIELCAPVKTSHKDKPPFCFRHTKPVPVMACTMVYGDFTHIKGAYLAFAKWLHKNSTYQMSDPMRQIVHRGPWNETDPAKYLTELQIPLERQQDLPSKI